MNLPCRRQVSWITMMGFAAFLGVLVQASTDPTTPDFTYQAVQLDLSLSESDTVQNDTWDAQHSLVQYRDSSNDSTSRDLSRDSFGIRPVVESIVYESLPTDDLISFRVNDPPEEYGSSLWSQEDGHLFGYLSSTAESSLTFEPTDEDDDDDADGQSSMLSNQSLRQSMVARRTVASASPGRSTTVLQDTRRHSMARVSRRHVSRRAVSRLRGGSSSSSTALVWSHVQRATTQLLESKTSRMLIVSAVVTLMFEACIGHILEFLKIVRQTQAGDTTYWNEIRTITARKGLVGLWDGFCPWGIVQSVSKGAVFGLAHASAIQVLVPWAERGILPMALALTIAGGVGGGFQGYVLSPTLLLKTRVMTNPIFREKMSLLRTTLLSFRIGYDVVQTEGALALMKGSNVFAAKRVFDWASRYFFADSFEALFALLHPGQPVTVAEKSVSSLLGGVFSTCVTLPLDVLVAKSQDAKKAGVKVSALKLFQDELKEKGLAGLSNAYMRGFEARLLHVCLTTLVIKTGTPMVYDAMFGSK